MRHEILRTEAVSAYIENKHALKDMWLYVHAGEFVGVTGLHNSGKTILTQILAGIHKKDRGAIFLDGTKMNSSDEALKLKEQVLYLGNSFLSSESFTVSENLSLFFSTRHKWGFMNARKLASMCEQLLSEAEFDISPHTKVGNLSEQERVMLELYSAIFSGRRIVICDAVFRNMPMLIKKYRDTTAKMLRKRHAALLMLSDDIDLLTSVCDTITVTRDGHTVKSLPRKDFSPDVIIRYMMSDARTEHPSLPPARRNIKAEETVLCCENLMLSTKSIQHPISFSVHRGEIIGLCSLNTEWSRLIAEVMSGREIRYHGSIYRNGSHVNQKFLSRQCCEQNKMCVLFGNHGRYSVMHNLSPEENGVFSSLKKISSVFGYLDKSIYTYSKLKLERLGIQVNKGLPEPISKLPFTQKFMISMERISTFAPELLVFLNPTDDLNITLKKVVMNSCTELASHGTGILFITHDLNEMREVCDRLLIISGDGTLKEFLPSEMTYESSYAMWQHLT